MRIRKRQAVVVEPAQATNRLSGGNNGNKDEYFVGQQGGCTCCSQQRRLQYWELRNEFERASDEPRKRFANGESVNGNHNEISVEDENDSIVSEPLEPTERPGSEQLLPEGDGNHPGNKPKESLLYSLFCVFSKLSGKAVLTAREALSRIIEQRLPGLDEETGLPSVQVAKVMRSNPYFVHLEGGKFFLCSAPSTYSKEDDLDSWDVYDNEEHPQKSTSPDYRPRIGPVNSLSSKMESEGGKQQQQSFSNMEVGRTKKARTKEVATIDNRASGKTENGFKGGSKREAQKKTPRTQKSVSDQRNNGADHPTDPICKRYDGRGWKCNEKALPGYSMCRHHHELIVNRLARLRSCGRLGSKKSVKKRKISAKSGKDRAGVNTSEGELSVQNISKMGTANRFI